MKFDSKKIRLTKKLKKLFEEKKGQTSGFNIYEIGRLLQQLIWIGYTENEPFYKRLQRVITDPKSRKQAHIFYEWQSGPNQENNNNNNRILKIRAFKKVR